ncbi:hypothetical protein KPL71_004301 [Citrus sinensis]|uniref:Uncharacterized protein n=1 Tax=Citrus sinensis TaxID=2711 RepID=A0ACB8N4Z1_CITSI|nr:hypothetical protein KPL71_004301 [Citrus sinensis]
MQHMELEINNKLAHIEEILSKLAESFNTSKDAPSINNNIATSRPNREDNDDRRQQFQSKVANMKFPHYAGDDPIEKFNRVNQLFEYQESTEDQKVRFGPTDCEDFDEALSRVKQTGTLRDYQKEFERLGNRVQGWTQKALVDTFMDGLKPEISEEIWLFRPRTLKKAISLARIRDKQLQRQKSMQKLLQKYAELFQEQKQLPPTREIDHRITLKERAEPINLEVLYRLLNEVTVKDIFLIPTVEDMLDELHGAAYVTKPNLRVGYHEELEYLGHFVTCHGVKMDEKKIAAMVSWPQPHNILELRGFLGLIGYCRKFVRGYGLLARNRCVRRWHWGSTTAKRKSHNLHELSFGSLKKGLVNVCEGNVGSGKGRVNEETLFIEHYEGEIKNAALEDDYMTKITQLAATQPDSPYTSLQEYVRKCETCQKTKVETLQPTGLLQSLPIPCQVWEDITLDFIKRLPNSQGRDTILAVVDMLSRYAHFMSLSHPFIVKSVAEKFVEGVVKLHGMPKTIVSDQDPIFISKFWQEFFTMSRTKLKISAPYHPQTDGQTEVVNRCLE